MHSNISIYTCFFGEAEIFQNECFKPLQVGSANTTLRLPMLQDNVGDNISALNPSFCEMTGVYWAWKNDKTSDYIGFCHYRRFLSFQNRTHQEADFHGMLHAKRIQSNFEEDFGLDAASVRSVVTCHDLILPYKIDVSLTGPVKSVREQYESSAFHHAKHLEFARRALMVLAPGDLKYFDELLNGPYIYPTNMFVMSRELFHRYCEWIFPLLFWLENKIDVMGLGAADRRAVGYLSERLLSTFVLKLLKDEPSLRIAEVDRLFIQNTRCKPKEPPLPESKLPIVSVVASTDESYAPHMAALVVSIAETIKEDVWLDLIILHGLLTSVTRRNLEELATSFSNISLSFVDMEGEYTDAKVHSYFPKATLYRLGVAELLHSRNRIIFIDTDGIVNEDLSSLGRMDMEGNLIAAVHDFTMESFQNMKVPVLQECGELNAMTYCERYLAMGAAANDYFQAGLVVMDLAAWRKEKLAKTMISDVLSRPYWFLDQDVMNKHLVGRVKWLDPKWNVVSLDTRHRSYLSNASQTTLARADAYPSFIHFAGYGKPWNSAGHAKAQEYWRCLRQTPFYEKTLLQTLRSSVIHHESPAIRGKGSSLSQFMQLVRKRFSKLGRSIRKRTSWRSRSRTH